MKKATTYTPDERNVIPKHWRGVQFSHNDIDEIRANNDKALEINRLPKFIDMPEGRADDRRKPD